MKFGQLIEYNVRNVFLQESCRKWDRETNSRPISKKKKKKRKAFYKVKASGLHLNFNIFR